MKLFNYITIAATDSECTVNGGSIPCDQLKEGFGDFFLGFGIIFVLLILFGIAAFAFTIWMIVDAANRNFDNKAVWLIIILLTEFIGAAIYYFAVKRPGDRRIKKSSEINESNENQNESDSLS